MGTLERAMSSRRHDDRAGPLSAAPPAAEPSAAAMSEDEAEEGEASSSGMRRTVHRPGPAATTRCEA